MRTLVHCVRKDALAIRKYWACVRWPWGCTPGKQDILYSSYRVLEALEECSAVLWKLWMLQGPRASGTLPSVFPDVIVRVKSASFACPNIVKPEALATLAKSPWLNAVSTSENLEM
jgi:hypothetical protein